MTTTATYTPSKIVAVFLVRFDMRTGYELVWSESTIPDFDFTGVDYKVLPSGIHETTNASVLISHKNKDKLYYGLGRFIQLAANDDYNNRDNVHMYSLGILCEPEVDEWKPNEFGNTGWEYVDMLDDALTQFLASDRTQFDAFRAFLNPFLDPSETKLNMSNHLITKLPELHEYLGPLVLPIFKQALLRKRILLFNNNHAHSHQLPRDYLFSIEAFGYLFSLMSMIPKDVRSADNAKFYSQPLYNIGLNDDEAFRTPGYIGTTNDDILMYQTDKYDVGVMLNANFKPEIYTNAGAKTGAIKSNLEDYAKLKFLAVNLDHGSGVVDADLRMLETNSLRLLMSNPDKPHDLDLLINVIGYFHKLTRKWFALIDDIVAEEMETGMSRLSIELSYQDVVDMELNPYDDTDLDFIRDFVLLYWEQVDNVDIGIGFSLCC